MSENRCEKMLRMTLKEYIRQIIYPHRRGIMGTVIFHLLLAIFLLSAEISRVRMPERVEIIVDTPEPEEIQQKAEEEQRKEEIRQKSSTEEVEQMLRAIAVNENAVDKKKGREVSIQQYINEVMNELESEGDAGNRYKTQRDKNYRKDSLQHITDRREEVLDSLRSTFYAGASSVTYNLKDRYAKILPIPVFKCEFGGKVVVAILVNRRGVVQKATIVDSESNPDDCLWRVAVDAAERSRFNERPDAPELQRGTITYNFVKQ